MMDGSREEKKLKDLHQGIPMAGGSQWFVPAWTIVALTVTVLSVMSPGLSFADDQPIPSITAGYQSGTITAIHENTLDIDGRAYSVVPDVIVLDEHGDPLDLARVMVTAEVKFHVTKEQRNMIDKMIVSNPR
jgi:hypothetical protein